MLYVLRGHESSSSPHSVTQRHYVLLLLYMMTKIRTFQQSISDNAEIRLIRTLHALQNLQTCRILTIWRGFIPQVTQMTSNYMIITNWKSINADIWTKQPRNNNVNNDKAVVIISTSFTPLWPCFFKNSWNLTDAEFPFFISHDNASFRNKQSHW